MINHKNKRKTVKLKAFKHTVFISERKRNDHDLRTPHYVVDARIVFKLCVGATVWMKNQNYFKKKMSCFWLSLDTNTTWYYNYIPG